MRRMAKNDNQWRLRRGKPTNVCIQSNETYSNHSVVMACGDGRKWHDIRSDKPDGAVCRRSHNALKQYYS